MFSYPKICAARLFMHAVLAIVACAPALAQTRVLTNAHAHNDYVHTHPFYDAYAQGFSSMEADIFLVDGQLLVAHNREDVSPEKTLQALYLDPLHRKFEQNHGHIYPAPVQFYLLVEIKDNPALTYPVLKQVLAHYSDMIAQYSGDRLSRPGAVRVVITGHRNIKAILADSPRLASADGGPADMNKGLSPAVIPWVSSDWKKSFTWDGVGTIPETDRQTMVNLVRQCHEKGYLIRFWGTPDTPAVWQAELDAGVDWINTDHLAEAAAFLNARAK